MHDRLRYSFLVQQLPSDQSFDYYKVIAANKTITFKNNAPVLRRHSLKHRKPDWKVHEGDIWNVAFKAQIIKAIEKKLKI